MVFNNGASARDCAVRDLSGTESRIYFADISELPPQFELEMPNKGLRVQARVVWSRGANHGVEFAEKIKRGPIPCAAPWPPNPSPDLAPAFVDPPFNRVWSNLPVRH